jgi:hypothetical protein
LRERRRVDALTRATASAHIARMKGGLLAFTGAFGFLIACGINAEFIPLNSPPRALTPRAPDQVEMFSAAMPSRPFVEVGTIEVQQE